AEGAGGTVQFLAAAADGNLWHTIRAADGSWQPAGDARQAAGITGPVTAIAAAASDAGVGESLAVAGDGRLGHTIRPADGSWQPAGDAGQAAQIPGPIVAVAAAISGAGVVEVLAVTGDGRLWHTIRAADGSWQPAGDAGQAAQIPGQVKAVAAAAAGP